MLARDVRACEVGDSETLPVCTGRQTSRSLKQPPEERGVLEAVFRRWGFTHFRRAAKTPFNLILEVRR